MFRNATLTIATLLVGTLGCLVACAPARPASSSAAPDIALDQAPATEAAESESSSVASSTGADAPAGDLVCRTKSAQGRTELYLTWSGGEATGVVRSIGASGAVTDTRVHAERHKTAIIADDINSTDLSAHLATVVENSGKRRIRVEELGQLRWSECE
jgi:hypothetical protein